MNEEAWLACADAGPMLDFVRGRASDRKLRLFLSGAGRSVAHLFFAPSSLAAVEVGERRADGLASVEEIDCAAREAEAPTLGHDFLEGYYGPYLRSGTTPHLRRLVELGALPEAVLTGGAWRVHEDVRTHLLWAARLAEACVGNALQFRMGGWWGLKLGLLDWSGHQLIHCVFGNPFRPVTFSPSWRTTAAVGLAAAVYESRDFSAMPVLADALEEAGCSDAAILSHCREQGMHVRGCWVVDGVLGKE